VDERPFGVRRASLADLGPVLVAAYGDDEWDRWAVPDDDRQGRLRTLIRVSLQTRAFPNGEVWMTDDATSVGWWLPIDGAPVNRDLASQADALTAEALGANRHRVLAVERRLDAVRPPGTWVLASVGTRSEARRRGQATAVLQPVLEHLDEIGVSASLETSSIANVAMYQKLGFEVVRHHLDLPHDAPTTWTMRRHPTLRP
jgi:ribosomal protein S18 acetylase RimI-like enzyme